MKPLRVAFFVKNRAGCFERENRNMGYFSYAVPEFEWEHFVAGDNIERDKFKNFDVIFIEDGGKPLEIIGPGAPVVYLVFDSTLTERHYQDRLARARVADLVLLDHDKIERFKSTGKPVRQSSSCVNDHVFKPLEKTLDISFMCSGGGTGGLPGGDERSAIRVMLGEYCKQAGLSYKSGIAGLPEYAEGMGRAKIVVNWSRTPINKTHRIFDAMACGACVVTRTLPCVESDKRSSLLHYVEFEAKEELPGIIEDLFIGDLYQRIAQEGYNLVVNNHTWAIRARELRGVFKEEFGI